jgi:hypothetical protein
MSTVADPVPLRRTVYTLLIVVAAASVLGRTLAVARVYEPYLFRAEGDSTDPRSAWPKTRPEPQPTLGGNDRSRWATIRALVDRGTYVIGHRDLDPATGTYREGGITTEDGWQTLDKVLHPQTHDYYSSKPPLLPTLLAGEYWLLKKVFGLSITDDRWTVVRVILLTINWLPFLIYLALLARLLESFGSTDWGRFYVLAAACFATLLTPFLIVLNNHTVAAWSALFALYPALRIWTSFGDPEARAGRSPWLFILAGFFAGFTTCNELPAASFTALLGLLLLLRAPGRTLAFFVPAAAVPVAALLFTNYLAIGEVIPAYSKLLSDWYQYEGSYWRLDSTQVRRGIDWAWQKEGKADYAFHLLVGHHGLFSLAPIYLLAVVGMLSGVWGIAIRKSKIPDVPALRLVAGMTLVLTLVVLGFYLFVAARMSNNYGGMTSGPRWLMWLTPFWLLTMLPVVDWLAGRRWGRGLAYLLLAVSVLSVTYPAWNPWRHPWIYNLMEAMNWIRY